MQRTVVLDIEDKVKNIVLVANLLRGEEIGTQIK